MTPRLIRVAAAALAALLLTFETGRALAQPQDPIITSQVMIRLRADVSVVDFLARYPAATLRVSIPGRNTHLLNTPAGQEDALAAAMLADPSGEVIWAEANYFGDAPEGSAQDFYFNVVPQPNFYESQPAWGQIGLPAAQQMGTGAGTVVAIVDTGLDAAHPAFAGRVLPNGYNFIEGNTNPADTGFDPPLDRDGDGLVNEMVGHGTHVAGVITHIAPGAQLLPIRALDGEGNSDNFLIAAGIYYAIDQGADIINLSLGSTYKSDMVEDAIAEALARGIVVIAASGNFDTIEPEEYPAFVEGVISVAAVDAADVKSDFSNYNPDMVISAPGSAIHSTLPGGLYGAWNGTSMSTPMVAGAAALLLGAHPEWPANIQRTEHLRSYLVQTADSIDAQNPNYVGLLGAGRLALDNAVQNFVLLDPPQNLPTGPLPRGVATGDFNRDGWPELAVVNSGGASVRVFRNDRYGNLTVEADYPTATGPEAVAAADFDRDGRLDLAVANAGGTVSLLRRDASGTTFEPALAIPGLALPAAIVAADFDADGDADLAISNSDDAGRVAILLNTGGTLAVHTTLTVGARPVGLFAARLDAGPTLDLVTANRRADSLSLLRGNGDGTFLPAQSIPVAGEPRGVAAADFDGDGDNDLAVACHDAANVALLANDGAGGFALIGVRPLGVGMQPETLFPFDADCDGATDLAVISDIDTTGFVNVLRNAGGLTFTGPLNFTVGALAETGAAADFDRDGDADLAISVNGASVVSVLMNRSCVPYVVGDMDCSGALNNFDIDGFALALTQPDAYALAYPACRIENADINGDGLVNNFDVDPFVARLLELP